MHVTLNMVFALSLMISIISWRKCELKLNVAENRTRKQLEIQTTVLTQKLFTLNLFNVREKNCSFVNS